MARNSIINKKNFENKAECPETSKNFQCMWTEIVVKDGLVNSLSSNASFFCAFQYLSSYQTGGSETRVNLPMFYFKHLSNINVSCIVYFCVQIGYIQTVCSLWFDEKFWLLLQHKIVWQLVKIRNVFSSCQCRKYWVIWNFKFSISLIKTCYKYWRALVIFWKPNQSSFDFMYWEHTVCQKNSRNPFFQSIH